MTLKLYTVADFVVISFYDLELLSRCIRHVSVSADVVTMLLMMLLLRLFVQSNCRNVLNR